MMKDMQYYLLVCGEGGEVFMVPTQQGQKKLKRPTHKDLGEKKKNSPTKEYC